MQNTFNDLGLIESSLKAVTELGFKTPTEIQMQTIPHVLAGFDVMGQAQTGTGKTAAFALPCLNRIEPNKGIQVLVMSPTRELSQQVGEEFRRLGKHQNIKVAIVVGGQSYAAQLRDLKVASVLVATPGRLNDLLRSKKLENFSPGVVVLDEADKMLDMGFAEDLQAIMAYLPVERQTLLFSATYPQNVVRLAEKIQKKNRKNIRVETASEANEDIEQSYCVVRNRDEKEAALFRVLDYQQPTKVLVFCEMKRDADQVGAMLLTRGFQAWILHGDTEQKRREEVMRNFRKAKKGILVATDVAARGLDVSDISHVINYQIPNYQDSYVHRIGRTGRAGKKGVAISILTQYEVRTLQRWGQRIGTEAKFLEIPTLSQLKKQSLESLKGKLENIIPEPVTLSAMAELEETFTADDLAARLLEYLLKDQDLKGPERIGLIEKDLSSRGGPSRGGSSGVRHQRRDGGRRYGGGERGGYSRNRPASGGAKPRYNDSGPRTPTR